MIKLNSNICKKITINNNICYLVSVRDNNSDIFATHINTTTQQSYQCFYEYNIMSNCYIREIAAKNNNFYIEKTQSLNDQNYATRGILIRLMYNTSYSNKRVLNLIFKNNSYLYIDQDVNGTKGFFKASYNGKEIELGAYKIDSSTVTPKCLDIFLGTTDDEGNCSAQFVYLANTSSLVNQYPQYYNIKGANASNNTGFEFNVKWEDLFDNNQIVIDNSMDQKNVTMQEVSILGVAPISN